MTDLHTTPAPIVLDPTGTDVSGEAKRLREHGPLVRVLIPGNIHAWAITDYTLLRKLFRDPRVSKDAYQHWPAFINEEIPADSPLTAWWTVRNMFTAYGADHTRLRKLVGAAFTPRRTEKLRGRITEITDELLDALAARPAGPVDLRAHFAELVPLRVITELMGVPEDLQPRLRVCVGEIFTTAPQRDPGENLAELVGLLTTLVARHRTEGTDPSQNMTSLLISHRDENEDRLTEQELVHTLLLVISAGYETTVNAIDYAIYQLLSRPKLLVQLRAGVFSWSSLVEETLRHTPPVANLPLRYAVEDIDDLDGVEHTIAQGEALIACIAAANRDTKLHGPNADEFDPTRTTKDHVAFGFGVHHCLGAPLARMEAEIALSALFGRFAEMTLAVPAETIETLDSCISHGHKTLPVYLRSPVEAAPELRDLIIDSVPTAIELRRPTDAVIDALATTGISTMTWSRQQGGAQLSMTDQHEVLKKLGSYDGSVAWVTAIGAAMPFMIGLFGDRTVSEVLGSDNSKACGVFSLTGTATPAAGGYRVSGQWPFVSGQHHAGWVLVPATVDGEAPVGLLVPRPDFAVDDDWDVTGLVGTASNRLSLSEMFVPSHRVIPFANLLEGICTDPDTTSHPSYYRQPLVPIICALSAGPAVGMAWRALDLLLDRIHTRPITYSAHNTAAASTATHLAVAEATFLLEAADACGRQAAETIDEHMRTGEPWNEATRKRGRALGSRAVHLAAKVAEIVADHSGANATIRRGDPLCTIISDLRALKQHAFLRYTTCAEEYGRDLCGLPPGINLY